MICGKYWLILALLISPFFHSQAQEKKEAKPSRSLQSQKYAIRLSAEVQADPPQIKLQWPKAGCQSYVLYRRTFGSKRWSASPAAVLKGDSVFFVDKEVKVGRQYEYRIDKFAEGFVGRSYICSGIDLPLVEQRGAVLLLVESSIAPALEKELRQMKRDLIGDGWRVILREVSRDEVESGNS